VRIYGFSDGRVLEVSSEDGHFDDWERQHLTAAPTGTEQKVFLEAADTVQERAHITELAASVGISAEDANRFFVQFKQLENALDQKYKDAQKSQTGSQEALWSQMRAAAEVELTKLASQTLGDKGPALVQKMVEGK
jgi:predicted phage-related endonuclease